MYYNARWLRSVPEAQRKGYDPGLGRFAQADTIIPLESQGVQAWDRYAYANNNAVRYSDPSGHFAIAAAAILFHPVTALLVGAIVIATLHNVLPGREKRTAATANAIEVGIEHIAQMGKKSYVGKNTGLFDERANDYKYGAPPPNDGDAIQAIRWLGGLYVASEVLGDPRVASAIEYFIGEFSNEEIVMPQETFIGAPQYPSCSGSLPNATIAPLTLSLGFPSVLLAQPSTYIGFVTKPASQDVLQVKPKPRWGGGGVTKPLMY